MKLGVIDFNRPEELGSAEDIKPTLTVAGNETIRLAWSNLTPNEDGSNLQSLWPTAHSVEIGCQIEPLFVQIVESVVSPAMRILE